MIESEKQLSELLNRTKGFHRAVAMQISNLTPYREERFTVAFQAGVLSIEHAMAALMLIGNELNASGYALFRPQFETLVRGVWLLHAASDTWIEKLNEPLTIESARRANSSLMLADMLKQLDNSTAPKHLIDQLKEFRDVTWKDLNSYVHGGIHPLSRMLSGYPPQLSYDVLRNSNALVAIAAQLTAIATGDKNNMAPVHVIHKDFADCLPII